MASYSITVNNKKFTVDADPAMPLLWVLRDILDLTGTKYGCGVNDCGACTVLINGSARRSCQIAIASCVEQQITTVEGLSEDLTHPIQKAWEKVGVPQCGYCQSGQMMVLAGLLNKNKKPTEQQVNEVMSANLCRCGTYHRIRQAVHLAIEEINSTN